MPWQRPIPDSDPPRKGSALVDSIVQAEKMIQVVLVMPCAGFIGWLAGAWLDSLLHTHWITGAGIVLGIVAGLVAAVRLTIALAGGKASGQGGPEGKDKE